MATYKPLFMYVAPASIPQIVAHIQKYLEENPILSDPEAIAAAISEYIAEHPELIAVASVNGKTGSVVLTGEDININATTKVTIATQIANLAAMIADAGGDIDTINDNIEDIYAELDGTEGIKARLTTVETDINDATNGIKVRLSGIEGEVNGEGGIDSRLTTVENDINEAQTGIKARLTEVETDVSGIDSDLNTAQTGIKARLSSAEGSISGLQEFVNGISSFANLKVEFGTVNITGNETPNPGQTEVVFNTPFTSAPFICTSIGGGTDTTFNERMLTAQVNGATNTRFLLVCKRAVDNTGTVGWGGRATVRWMAIGS